jgi:hypothetical protein
MPIISETSSPKAKANAKGSGGRMERDRGREAHEGREGIREQR